MKRSVAPAGYDQFFARVKARVESAQMRAALAVNRELLRLYWSIGRDLVARQEREGWGTSVVERLARDLRVAFPGVEGFSARNVWRMRALYVAYRPARPILPPAVAELADNEDLPQAVAELPWAHHVVLLEKLKDAKLRAWYAAAAQQHGWSRNILAMQIQSGLHRRAGKSITNFKATLPPPQSDLAQETLKDPYLFDFLTVAAQAHERDVERGLIEHVRDFLLELGVGFAFVGSQVHIAVGDQDFFLDLVFYHLKLRCFVVLELKTGHFKPEYAGKMNFYLSAVDEQLRHADDQPSIGLVLCREKNRVIVEYALRDTTKPIGVSAYRVSEKLPAKLEGSLPTVEQLEAELGATKKKR